MFRIRVGLAIVTVALLSPTGALAHRRATRGERRWIIRAAVDQGELSRRQAHCQRVTVSTVRPSYATLTWPPRLSHGCAEVAANGVIIERRRHDGWQLVAAGSSLPCPLGGVPTVVARDLGLCHRGRDRGDASS